MSVLRKKLEELRGVIYKLRGGRTEALDPFNLSHDDLASHFIIEEEGLLDGMDNVVIDTVLMLDRGGDLVFSGRNGWEGIQYSLSEVRRSYLDNKGELKVYKRTTKVD